MNNHTELNRKAAEIAGFEEFDIGIGDSTAYKARGIVGIKKEHWNPAADLNQIFKYLVPKLKGVRVVLTTFDDGSGNVEIIKDNHPMCTLCSESFVDYQIAPTLLAAILEGMEKVK